jgi:hypothetical protein
MRRGRGALFVSMGVAVLLTARPADAAPVVTKVLVPVTKATHDPCTGEGVLLMGNFEAEFLASTGGSGDIVVRFAFQAAGVEGVGVSSGVHYLLVGQGHGTSIGGHGERLVTAADFTSIAFAEPGVDVHRAQVSTTLGFTVQVDGAIVDVSVDSVVIDQSDC